jgi:hypothetical protein
MAVSPSGPRSSPLRPLNSNLNGRRGRQTIPERAAVAIRLARLPDDGPTGGFFGASEPQPWLGALKGGEGCYSRKRVPTAAAFPQRAQAALSQQPPPEQNVCVTWVRTAIVLWQRARIHYCNCCQKCAVVVAHMKVITVTRESAYLLQNMRRSFPSPRTGAAKSASASIRLPGRLQ